MIYLLLLVFMSSHAELTENKSLVKEFKYDALINEIIAFEPVEGHKFNLKSKNRCGQGRLISANENKIECQMTTIGDSELELYVCDKKNTYCKREIVNINTQKPQGIGSWLSYYWNRVFKSQGWQAPFRTETSHNKVARGFLPNDLEGAISVAKRENKKILVYFTQIFCPPCRLLKEMTIETDAFQEASKDLVKVQVDTDIDVSPERLRPLNQKFTPTMIILNSDFEEIDRRVGTMSPQLFNSWMRLLAQTNWATADKLLSLPEHNAADKLRLSLWHMNRFENKAAMNFVSKLNDYPLFKGIVLAYNEEDANKKINMINQLPLGKMDCLNWDFDILFEQIGEVMDAAVAKKDTALFGRAESLALKIDSGFQKLTDDPLQCAYNRDTIYSYLAYYYQKMGENKKLSSLRERQINLIDSFPKLDGVKETTQLAVMKAKAKEDQKAKTELYDKMRAANEKDYTYDYWEASEAFRKKDYAKALEKIDQSLKIAKDRSWEKAFQLKIEILKAMDKKQEAMGLIEGTLNQMRLPYSKYPKIHGFVQQLREKQRELF